MAPWRNPFSRHFDILFFRDRIRISDRRTGRSLERTASSALSKERPLLADKGAASALLKDLLVTLDPDRRYLRVWITADVIIDDPSARREDADTIRRLLTDCGFTRVRIRPS
jgi:hypothetical protein